MTTRRTFVRTIAVALVALGIMVVPALATEFFGVLTRADPANRTVTVVEKGSARETVLKVTDDTEFVTPKKSGKIDLTRIDRQLTKAQEKGRKGIPVSVTHEDGQASKIEVATPRKGDAPRKKGTPRKKADANP